VFDFISVRVFDSVSVSKIYETKYVKHIRFLFHQSFLWVKYKSKNLRFKILNIGIIPTISVPSILFSSFADP